MKMLKKLAALVLAATMVLVLFTACGGDTPSTPEAQAEAQMMSTINKNRGSAVQLCNDTELKQEAEKFLDSAVDINTGFLKFAHRVKLTVMIRVFIRPRSWSRMSIPVNCWKSSLN